MRKSSRCRCSQNWVGVLKNFANFTEKHQCWSLFLIKLQDTCFAVKFAKFLRTLFNGTPPEAASEYNKRKL